VAGRLFASRLDRRLAAGTAPESGRLLASRAQTLVSAAARSALADNWHHLLRAARRPPTPITGRAPLCRDRITGAEPEIRQMIDALVAPAPLAAGAVAMAGLLLSDGTGPLYNRGCTLDVRETVRQVTARLDPSASLVRSP
jgi:hypothetical protein